MITAIVKMQSCTTRPGRRVFVPKGHATHGIAKGAVRYYQVIAPSWAAVRSAVASCDTTGGRTMGFSAVGPDTVVSFVQYDKPGTGSSVRPMPGRWLPAA